VVARTSKTQKEIEQITPIFGKITIEKIEQKLFEGNKLTLVEK